MKNINGLTKNSKESFLFIVSRFLQCATENCKQKTDKYGDYS